MEFARAREFLLGAYHDLPNVLMTGSLLFGSVAGHRPLLWLAVGLLLFNLPVTYLLQFIITKCGGGPTFAVDKSERCATYVVPPMVDGNVNSTTSSTIPILDAVGPTWWMTSAFFFIIFTLWNAGSVYSAENENATPVQKANRNAYCLSVIVISCIFLILAGARMMSGCEKWYSAILGAFVGGLLGLGYWNILDACGNGLVPDILQIVGNSAPQRSADTTPVVCT